MTHIGIPLEQGCQRTRLFLQAFGITMFLFGIGGSFSLFGTGLSAGLIMAYLYMCAIFFVPLGLIIALSNIRRGLGADYAYLSIGFGCALGSQIIRFLSAVL